jgi:peptide/nickel transport system substrate-binding protein
MGGENVYANGSGRAVIQGRSSRRRVLQGGAGLAAGAAAFLLACGSDKKEETKATAAPGGSGTTAAGAAGQPKSGGTMPDMITAGLANNRNPVTNWWEGQGVSGNLVYDRLITNRLGKDTAKEYILEAAQSVEQPDQTTIVFKLKPGMKFQNKAPVNGRAVTGEDVVKSMLYVKGEPAAQDSSFQNGSMQSVEAPDAQTVVFKLKAPNAYAFSATQLAYPQSTCIIPKELLEKLDTAAPVGSGPYEETEANINVRYRFKRFEGYHGASKGLPYIQERDIRIVTDPAAQEAAFRSEQSFAWANIQPNTVADKIKQDLGAKIVMEESQTLSPFPLILNATKPPFNDVRVRQAVYRAVDRKQFLDLLDGGRGALPPGVLSIGLSEYQLTAAQTEKYWKQDAKEAKQLLDAAGYDYNKEYTMLTLNLPKNNQGGEIFQQQMSKVGIKLTLRTPVTLGDWHDNMEKGSFDTAYAAMPGYDSPQKVLRFQHSNSLSAYKYTGPRNPTIDAMIDKSEVTLDKNERIKQVKDIQLALLDVYTPFFLTHNFIFYTGVWKYVKEYEINPASHNMPRVTMWLDK